MFRIFGLPSARFSGLASLDAAALAARGVRRVVADSVPGYPCRVSLEDAAVGEELWLLSYVHHDVDSPYRASGPIYVRVGAREAALQPGELPACVRSRLVSVRAYDDRHLMVAAQVCDGAGAAEALEAVFADPRVAYAHLHNAKPGCFSCEARPSR